jgi:hypothetical protein
MSKYRVEYLDRDGPYPQDYRYAIWRGKEKVAEFGHDFRNDERWLIVGSVTKLDSTRLYDIEMLTGGGDEPLVVSEAGTKLLDWLLGS